MSLLLLLIIVLMIIPFLIGYKISYTKYSNKMLELLKEFRLAERITEADFIYYKDKYLFKTYKNSWNKTKMLIKKDFNRIKSLFIRNKRDVIDDKK